LLAFLAPAFGRAFVVGIWEANVKQLKPKKHSHPQKSFPYCGHTFSVI
jgi:hypothetical protein